MAAVPYSAYSSLVYKESRKAMSDAKMDPPIQALCILSAGAVVLTWHGPCVRIIESEVIEWIITHMSADAKACISLLMRSANPGSMVVPPVMIIFLRN